MVQYAEKLPRKSEDICPFHLETDAWMELWNELKEIVVFCILGEVRICRVDNPHIEPFAFWEWLIADVKRTCPQTIFLAEAYTGPKVDYHLPRAGFTRYYNHFAWRNTKWKIIQYLTEFFESDVRENHRLNDWSTPC